MNKILGPKSDKLFENNKTIMSFENNNAPPPHTKNKQCPHWGDTETKTIKQEGLREVVQKRADADKYDQTAL